MGNTDKIHNHERALRKEFAQRTVNMSSSDEAERITAGDPPEMVKIGREISRLIDDERLEEARQRLAAELQKQPQELMLLNFQMILDSLDKPFGNYDQARKTGARLIAGAVEQNNAYYTMVAINNLGLIAHNEGHEEFSLAMYLAAHFIDNKALFTLCNLIGWYSRRRNFEKAMFWVERIIDYNSDWLSNDEIVSFFTKDESLHNLRNHNEFKIKILSRIKR